MDFELLIQTFIRRIETKLQFVALVFCLQIILKNLIPVYSYNTFQKIRIIMNIIKEYIFTLLSFYSSFDTFDVNFKHTFLVPKFSVIISCTMFLNNLSIRYHLHT